MLRSLSEILWLPPLLAVALVGCADTPDEVSGDDGVLSAFDIGTDDGLGDGFDGSAGVTSATATGMPSADTSTGADTSTSADTTGTSGETGTSSDDYAEGIHIGTIEVNQGVAVTVASAGTLLSTGQRNARIIKNRPGLFRVYWELDGGFAPRDILAQLELFRS